MKDSKETDPGRFVPTIELDLLPCPFCGSQPLAEAYGEWFNIEKQQHRGEPFFLIRCGDYTEWPYGDRCDEGNFEHSHVQRASWVSWEDVANKWNTRNRKVVAKQPPEITERLKVRDYLVEELSSNIESIQTALKRWPPWE